MPSSSLLANTPIVVVGLRQWRRLRNLSQAELAARIGVSTTQVSAWETGRSLPHLRYIRRLLQVLEAPSLDALFPESPPTPPTRSRKS
jgi:transcriptional regulator with XRE-family HTH domain